MATPRHRVVTKGVSGCYLATTVCTRRLLMCTEGPDSGDRGLNVKKVICDRMDELSEVYTIGTYAYAVMKNHHHTVLAVSVEEAEALAPVEVVRRWFKIHPPARYKKNREESVLEEEIALVVDDVDRVKELRSRLCDPSWYMKDLNEYVARLANDALKESGPFWQPRFHCKRLADKRAILMAMIYVDSNPIRSGLAQSPEQSKYTGCYDRINAIRAQKEINHLMKLSKKKALSHAERKRWARAMKSIKKAKSLIQLSPDDPRNILGLTELEYLKLLDWTGRQVKPDKKGFIPEWFPPILKRIGIRQQYYPESIRNLEGLFRCIVGSVSTLREAAQKAGRTWFVGLTASRLTFSA
jgi:putative transposase